MIRRALIKHLKEVSGVKTVLGDRIYPLEIPANVKESPAASVVVSSAARTHSKDGPTRQVKAEIYIVCWSRRVLDCENAQNAIRKALDGFRGQMQGLTIKSIRSGTERDLAEYIDVIGAYGVALDYTVDYEEE